MPKKFMHVAEVAEYLGVTVRTVRAYVRDGLLLPVKVAGTKAHHFDPDEVASLQEEKSAHGAQGIRHRKELLDMKSRLRRVESQMKVVLRILDAKDDPLRMDAEYAKQLHSVAIQQLGVTGWHPVELEPWVEIFLRIDEEDFNVIYQCTQDAKAWRPFLLLCRRMTQYVYSRPDYETSLELQATHKQLAEGRRRLRVSAMCFADLYTGDLDAELRRHALADTPASILDVLENTLRKPKKAG